MSHDRLHARSIKYSNAHVATNSLASVYETYTQKQKKKKNTLINDYRVIYGLGWATSRHPTHES